MCGRITAAGSRLRKSSDGLAVAFPDAYPLAPGHTLVVPRRHEPDLLGLTRAESLALWSLTMDLCREIIVSPYRVMYRRRDDRVEIVAIRHEARAFDEREVSP